MFQIHQLEMECTVDLIKNQDVILAQLHLLIGKLNSILSILSVFFLWIGILLNTAEASSNENQLHKTVHLLHTVPFSAIEIFLHKFG